MNGTVLVVDDEATIRLVLGGRLRDAGFKVDVAADGFEAIAKLEQEPFEAVLLDLNMPGMGGLQVLDFLQENFPDIETIVLTGYGDINTAVACLKRGAKDFVVKPFDYNELIAKIGSLLRAKHSEQSLREVRQRWQSTMVYDMFGTMFTVSTLLDHIQSHMPPHQNAVADMFGYARTLTHRVFDRIQESVDLREIARTDVTLHIESALFQELLNATCDRFERWVHGGSLKIIRNIDAAMPRVSCDVARTEQILYTLFDTVITATDAEGEVTVQAGPAGVEGHDFVSASISYEGELPIPDELPIVLAEQPEPGERSVSLGGISLAMSRRLLELQGGTFGVEQGPSGRVVLSFTMPLDVANGKTGKQTPPL